MTNVEKALCKKETWKLICYAIRLTDLTGARNVISRMFNRMFRIIHTLRVKLICTFCRFKTANILKKHQTIHSDNKTHQCTICDKFFRAKGTLREHMRIHTGAMPFTCEFCGKSFRFKGILTVRPLVTIF